MHGLTNVLDAAGGQGRTIRPSGTRQTPANGRPTQASGAPYLSRMGEPLWHTLGCGRDRVGKAVRSPIPWARGPGSSFALYPVTGLVQGRALLDGWCPMRRRGRRYERGDELVAAPRLDPGDELVGLHASPICMRDGF